jgi:hypothetical protein
MIKTDSRYVDLCIAWNWEYDSGFVDILQATFDSRNLSLLQVTQQNLEPVLLDLVNDQLNFGGFIDRASDSDERFLPLVDWVRNHSVKRINPYRLARRAWNKADMDEQFRQAGLMTPVTIVLPSYDNQPCLQPIDLSCLGDGFAIKPAHGGGGRGVHTGMVCWEQVNLARQEYSDDQYLLQAQVNPVQLGEHPAWFRVINFAGKIYPCWWEPNSHLYTPVSESEENQLALQPLRLIAATIGWICQLDLFSTEIAIDAQGHYLVIDHVNDPIDLRLKSQAVDGMPDEIAWAIAEGLADFALKA